MLCRVALGTQIVNYSSGLFMGLSSTIIYTSESILCSTLYLYSKLEALKKDSAWGFLNSPNEILS